MGTALPLLLVALLAAPVQPAAPGRSATRPVAVFGRLDAARAQLKALLRDPVKRRFRHNWEKAIKGLLACAAGKDAPAATLEAAKARYALYRWSANEADRDEALRLANRAARLGDARGSRFAAAIRREAGDDRPAPSRPHVAARPVRPPELARAAGLKPAPVAAPVPVPPRVISTPLAAALTAPNVEPEPEPELEEAVADLKEAPEPAVASSRLQPASASEEGGERRPIRRVVIDPGHGGLDPGAIGPSQVREKDVTLAMSRKLQKLLEKAGFEVVMTRSDDRYMSLEDRTALANARHGDLFISIHANASRVRSLAGVETWVLNVADDRYSKRLAARENGANPELDGEGTDARRILTDLNAKAATDASRVLAQAVQRDITTSVRERIGDVQDLGVKNALFYVLLGARMPAVLVETGFISNRLEEQRLASSRYQDEVASAVARAVVTFATQPPRLARAD